jgi:hypothetical protein
VTGGPDLGLSEENARDIAEGKPAGRADVVGNLVIVDDPPARPSQRTERVAPESQSQNQEDGDAEETLEPAAPHRAVNP